MTLPVPVRKVRISLLYSSLKLVRIGILIWTLNTTSTIILKGQAIVWSVLRARLSHRNRERPLTRCLYSGRPVWERPTYAMRSVTAFRRFIRKRRCCIYQLTFLPYNIRKPSGKIRQMISCIFIKAWMCWFWTISRNWSVKIRHRIHFSIYSITCICWANSWSLLPIKLPSICREWRNVWLPVWNGGWRQSWIARIWICARKSWRIRSAMTVWWFRMTCSILLQATWRRMYAMWKVSLRPCWLILRRSTGWSTCHWPNRWWAASWNWKRSRCLWNRFRM